MDWFAQPIRHTRLEFILLILGVGLLCTVSGYAGVRLQPAPGPWRQLTQFSGFCMPRVYTVYAPDGRAWRANDYYAVADAPQGSVAHLTPAPEAYFRLHDGAWQPATEAEYAAVASARR